MRYVDINPPLCKWCGKPLPLGCWHSQKYHAECRLEKKRLEKPNQKPQKKKDYMDITHPDSKDREYCRKCFYREVNTWNFLCNYYLMTGKRRGCNAGVGCNKRLIK